LRVISAARAERRKASLANLDQHMKALHTDGSPGTRTALVLLAVSRVVAWGSTTVVLAAVGVHVHPTLVIGVVSVGVLISWISAFVPFGLGIADGSNYALFDALGASGAHGVFVTLLNRARTLSIALIGLVVMAIGHAATRVAITRRHRRSAARLAQGSPTTLA
jgi:hypothetical protein